MPAADRRRTCVALLVAVGVVAALSGCTGGSASGTPTANAQKAGAATGSTTAPAAGAPAPLATPAAGPSPWTALPTLAKGPNKGTHLGVVLASSAADTDPERAAVQGYVDYLRTVLVLQRRATVDDAALARTARGAAATQVKVYVVSLKRRKAHTIGWASVNVDGVAATGATARVTACIDNGTRDVADATGKTVTRPDAGYDAEATLSRTGKRWRVTFSSLQVRTARCG